MKDVLAKFINQKLKFVVNVSKIMDLLFLSSTLHLPINCHKRMVSWVDSVLIISDIS